ncbi:response regulator receiver domain protein (CheY-like) [Sulfurimonas denitrificans DSM 1251]|uniref:Response regulator receiver domain protein (CheY-like) n=1 Tax=Sulfurimonas denitrificans (strain ATCC 33889 / DSM 1251) TaxID=326298 RepID=Q30RY5_SULDN|nr:response regulator [Sulfurimonas denitrificans]ABB44246.1 response regulator receiver domain protein (CheY-like) [Sulfurimonas denitrificans DSM 1251]MDD3443500.1 response regulator [Sulfurimonas denitrificans]
MSIVKELKDFAKNLSVIIVEDDKALNEELVGVTELFFKRVFFAYNGVEALSIYKNNNIDIVITDITMPKMDGVVLSRNLKQINPNQDIVVISAHRDIEYLVKLVDIGIKQLIYKPFDHQELLYRLLRVCEDKVLSNKMDEYKEDCSSLLNTTTVANNSIQNKKAIYKNQNRTILHLNSEMEQDIEYLLELRDDLENLVNELHYGVEVSVINGISSVLSKIYTLLSQIGATTKISVVIFELANFLESINFELLSDEQKSKLEMMEFIYDDIAKFVDLIFVKREVQDTSYLEDSLRSSLSQLKQSVFNDFLVEEEFELF